jgi:hypothetical protein
MSSSTSRSIVSWAARGGTEGWWHACIFFPLPSYIGSRPVPFVSFPLLTALTVPIIRYPCTAHISFNYMMPPSHFKSQNCRFPRVPVLPRQPAPATVATGIVPRQNLQPVPDPLTPCQIKTRVGGFISVQERVRTRTWTQRNKDSEM